MLRYTVIDRPGEHEHTAGWHDRCVYCGHRVPVDGVDPIETRRQPWRIPSEMVLRYRAMRRGR